MVCVVGCHCSVSPALHFTLLSHNWGKGPQGLFPQPHPHCVLPLQTLVLFPIISPSILDPEMVSHGVRFQEKLIKRSFSPVTVVQLRSSPLTLQARLTCWREDNGLINGSWQFGFNGPLCLSFDVDNGRWRVHHPGGREMKQKWENSRAVTDFFKKVSRGDCWLCFQAFLEHCKKMLKATASLTTGPPTVKSSATAIKHITWILPMLLTSFIITVFLG
uniref:UL16-binding protein 3-like n=1 Tax=Bos indicus x Bos taurus TaxID=30522 RepID=A0A4W2GHD6_BOBOX